MSNDKSLMMKQRGSFSFLATLEEFKYQAQSIS